MKNNILKGVLLVIVMIMSPFAVVALIGTIYTAFQMINGVTFISGVQSFINFIYSLVPYFSYLTVIPVFIVAALLLVKNRSYGV
mgnify:CR=1 FL=1